MPRSILRRRLPVLAAIVSAAAWPATAAGQTSAQQAAQFVGVWEGTIELGPNRLRIGLTVARDSLGGLRGFMTSIDQAGARIPSTMALHGDTLVVDMPLASAAYRGVITAARDTLRGTFTQGGSTPLDLHRTAALSAAAARPQEPKPPFPYRTEEVSFESAPGVRLAGTLTIPAGAGGPFPAVVFVTGSGPQDRDENLLGHKPFLLIADYLARRNIASLRFDDRGTAKSTGDFAAATSVDFANDAEAGVRFLRSNAAIARDRVGILGHSEGGMIGPMVAARSSDVAFLVLLAGPGIPGDSILVLQQRLVATAAGAPAADIEFGARLNRIAFAAIKAGGGSAAMIARIRAGVDELVPTLTPVQRLQATPDAIVHQLAQTVTPWFRYFITYDPRPTLRRIRVPVLALNGTLDVQVPYKENLSAIDAALKEAGNRDYRVLELPQLNHLFQTAKTGGVGEYATIDETMSPAALEAIASWITERFVRR